MAVRGPTVPEGRKSLDVTGNIDIAPTALKLAGVTPDYEMDGRPLQSSWRNPGVRSRRPVGISLRLLPRIADAGISNKAPILNYEGFRVGPYKFVDYERGGQELYDLSRDPFEMNNRIGSARYAGVREYMESHLEEVARCEAAACRAALPPWPEPGN